MFKRIIYVGLVAVMAFAGVSCQDSDEKTGAEYLNEIVSKLEALNDQDKVVVSNENDHIYQIGVESAEEAWKCCSEWVYSDVNESSVFVIPDGMGRIEVAVADTEGAYLYVTFKLEGYHEFRVEYLNPEYMNDDNFFIRQPFPPKKKPTAL